MSEHRDPCHLSAPAGVQPSSDLVDSSWWINPVERRLRPARRVDREFAAIAAQLCLAAWMLGLLIEASCVLVGPPRPAVAAAVSSPTALSSAPSRSAASVARASTVAQP